MLVMSRHPWNIPGLGILIILSRIDSELILCLIQYVQTFIIGEDLGQVVSTLNENK